MVAKIGKTSNLYAALKYNSIKVEEEQASVLCCHKMIEPYGSEGYTLSSALRSFEPYLTANRRTEQPVIHISLNPDPDDRVDNERFKAMAEDYMHQMGYGDQPYMVFLHEDIARRHLHIVTTCVDENGRRLSDRFEHRRSMAACRKIEQQYGLIPAVSKKREDIPNIQPLSYKDGDIRAQMQHVIRMAARDYRYAALKEYATLLCVYRIGVEETSGFRNGKAYRGLTYHALDNNGQRVGQPLKSSLIGRYAGIPALERHMEKSAREIRADAGVRERTKSVLSDAMRRPMNREDLTAFLKGHGIHAVFRYNDTGRLYGATFIDHTTRAVLNGSRMGKAFAAGAWEEYFQHPPVQPQQKPLHGHEPEGVDAHRDKRQDEKEEKPVRTPQMAVPVTGSASPSAGSEGDSFSQHDERYCESVSDRAFGLFTGETVQDEIAEAEFVRQLRRKKKKGRSMR